MSPNIEAVRQFFTAINRGDVPGVMGHFDPEIVRIEFEGTPNGGIYLGLAEVQTHVAKGRGTWGRVRASRRNYSSTGTKWSPTSTSACV